MITSANQIPRSGSLEFSTSQCPTCSEDTANVCGRCGCLKCPQLEHVGRLPPGAHDVMTGRNPSWRMLHLSVLLGTIGGLLIGLDFDTLLGWL